MPGRSVRPRCPTCRPSPSRVCAGFDSSSWVALVAPAKTPAPVLAKLRAEVAKVLTSPDIVARIRELGSEPGTATEKDVRAFMDGETKKWAEVIRISGAKAD